MDLITCLVLWGSLLPVLPILYFTLKNETNLKKNIAAGVALPYAARMDAGVELRLKQYVRELGIACLGMGLAAIPGLFIRNAEWAIFLWGLWVLLLVVVPMIPYIRCNRDLRTLKTARGWSADGDDKWIWGLFYHNPHDRRFFIRARAGANYTVNLARPAGRLMAALLALMLVTMPFMGFFTGSATGRPIELVYENGILTATHGRRTYTVDSIERAELLHELPAGLIRVMGTGTPNLLKGDFRAKGISHLNVCVDPGCPPYILVESDGEYCLFGTRDAAATKSIYEQIK